MAKPFYGELSVGPCANKLALTCPFPSSSIIESIKSIAHLHRGDEKIGYAYFFFDGRDSQKDLQLHDKFIRSLIMQFSFRRDGDGIPTILVDLYGHGQEQPSTRALQDTLQCILDGFHSAYIIIDSLDECTERDKVLGWIKKIDSQNMGNLHVVIASRPEQDIGDVVGGLANVRCVDMGEEAVNDDIATYLEQQISGTDWDEGTRERVKLALMNGAHGMYAFFDQFNVKILLLKTFLGFDGLHYSLLS